MTHNPEPCNHCGESMTHVPIEECPVNTTDADFSFDTEESYDDTSFDSYPDFDTREFESDENFFVPERVFFED